MPLDDNAHSAIRSVLGIQTETELDDDARAALESVMTEQPETERTIGRTVGDVAVSLSKGVVGLGESAVGLANLPTFGLFGKTLQDTVGYDPKKTQEALSDLYSDPQKEAFRKVDEVEGFVPSAKAMIQNPSTIAHSVVESSPSMLGGAAGARQLIKIAPKLSPIIAAAIGEGAIGAGQTAEQIRQESPTGYITPAQALASVGSGVGTGAFAVIGGKLASKLGVADIDTWLTGAGVKGGKAGVIKRIISGGISEGLFEEFPQSVQERVWLNAALEKPLLEGVPKAGVQGAFAGVAMGGGANVFIKGKPENEKILDEKRKTAEEILGSKVDDIKVSGKKTAKEIIEKIREDYANKSVEKPLARDLIARMKNQRLMNIEAAKEKYGVQPTTVEAPILPPAPESPLKTPSPVSSAGTSEAPGQTIMAAELDKGDKVTIKGEEYEVKGMEEGRVVLKDGETLKPLPEEDLTVDKIEKAPAVAKVETGGSQIKEVAEQNDATFQGAWPDGNAWSLIDNVTKGNFTVSKAEEIPTKLAELREKFAKAEEKRNALAKEPFRMTKDEFASLGLKNNYWEKDGKWFTAVEGKEIEVSEKEINRLKEDVFSGSHKLRVKDAVKSGNLTPDEAISLHKSAYPDIETWPEMKPEAKGEKAQWYIDVDDRPVFTVPSDATGYRGPYSKREVSELTGTDYSYLDKKEKGKPVYTPDKPATPTAPSPDKATSPNTPTTEIISKEGKGKGEKGAEKVIKGKKSESAPKEDTKYSLGTKPQAFYSKLEQAINAKPISKMPASQLRSMLKGMGVTDAEMDNLIGGLEGTVTKQEVIDEIKANSVVLEDVVLGDKENPKLDKYARKIFGVGYNALSVAEQAETQSAVGVAENSTHFSQYQEPGYIPGSYREMFVTAPKANNIVKKLTEQEQRRYDSLHKKLNDYAKGISGPLSSSEAEEYTSYIGREKIKFGWQDGHSQYSDIKNPVVRIRFNDREVDGKRILFIEEMQGPNPTNQKKMPEWLQKRIYDLGVKRVLAYAKENGYDGVSWTPGEMQAERYDLSKQIESLEYTKNHDGTYEVVARKEGTLLDMPYEWGVIKETELEKYVGKDAAKKIIDGRGRKTEEGYRELSNIDLKVGGEGLKRLYDSTIPAMFKKYGKEAVGKTFIELGDPDNAESLPSSDKYIDEGGFEAPFIPITAKTPGSYPMYSMDKANANLTALTESDVKDVFKWADSVKKNEDGTFSVFKNGQRITVESVDHIAIDDAIFKANIGRQPTNAEKAIGARGSKKGLTIQVSKIGDKWTLAHESYHMLEDAGFVNQVDVIAINQALHKEGIEKPTFEDRAVWVEQNLKSRAEKSNVLAKVLQKIQDLIDSFVNLFQRTSKGVLRNIESGKIGQDRTSPVFEFAQSAKYSIGEAVKKITDNPKFVKWFGDSKVVDDKGEPLIVYHGTQGEPITAFDKTKLGTNTKARTAQLGFFFTNDNPVGEKFGGFNRGYEPQAVFLSMQKPIIIESEYVTRESSFGTAIPIKDNYGRNRIAKDAYDVLWGYAEGFTGKKRKDITTEDMRSWAKKIQELGSDGIILKNTKMDAEFSWNTHYIVFEPTQIKSIFNTEFDPNNPDIRYSAVFHGTPHVWKPEPGFPHGRPRLDMIGTGEGAAAYGWGWYSADVQDTATSYMRPGSQLISKINGTTYRIDTDEILNMDTGKYLSGYDYDVVHSLFASDFNREEAIEDFEYRYRNKKDKAELAPYIQKIRDAKVETSSLYKLDIPDDVIPKLLDWDKPITEQSNAIQDKIKQAFKERKFDDGQIKSMFDRNITGEQAYVYLSSSAGKQGASELLQRIGIPGNKYLDQMSRNKPQWKVNYGKGGGYSLFNNKIDAEKDAKANNGMVESSLDTTHNYVIWDQKVLDRIALLERNGEKLDAIREAEETKYSLASPEAYWNETIAGRLPRTMGQIQDWLVQNGHDDKAEKIATYLWDKDASIAKVQKSLGEQPVERDYVLAKKLMGSAIVEEIKEFDKKELQPFLKHLADSGLSIADVEKLAHAEHAPERNLQMKRVNARRYIDAIAEQMYAEDKRNIEDSVVDAKTEAIMDDASLKELQDKYIGILDKLAQEIISTEEAVSAEIDKDQEVLDNREFTDTEINKGTPERLQKKIDNARNKLQRRLEIARQWEDVKDRLSGMTDEQATEISSKWLDDGNMEQAVEMLRSINSKTLDTLLQSGEITPEEYNSMKSVYQKHVPLMREDFEDKRMTKGRSGTGPLAKPLKIAYGSVKGVSNILAHVVDRRQASIARKHELAAGKTLYELVKANPDESKWAIVEAAKEPRRDNEGNIRLYTSHKEEPNQVHIKIDGKKYIIEVPSDNPQMMRFMEAVKRQQTPLDPIFRASQKLTRLMASLNTYFSPEFLMTNFAKDLQTAMIHLEDSEAAGMQKKVFKNIKSAIKGIYASERGNEDSEWAKIYKQYSKLGGKIGWMQSYENVQKLAESLQKELEFKEGRYPNKEKLRKLGDWIGAMNTAVENGVRLATFKALVDSGVHPMKAAQVAKSLTVDFTQHGTAGSLINSLYMFANAGIQGNVRMIKALAKSKKVRHIATGIVGFGAIANFLGAALGGDDDDGEAYYDKLKRTNPGMFERSMVFMIPGTKGDYIKIPMPYGYNTFFVLGNEMASAIRGNSPIEAGANVVTALMGTLNPLSAATFLQTVTPTVLDPIAQVYENKAWHGGKLMPEKNPFGMPIPDSQRYFESVNPVAKYFTAFVNSMTGGDKFTPGIMDVSPETVEMMFETYTGAAGRFAKDVLSIPVSTFSEDGLSIRQVPFARKFIGSSPSFVSTQIFQENRDKVDVLVKRFQEADTEERMKLLKDPIFPMLRLHKKTESQLRKLNKAVKLAEKMNKPEYAKKLKEQMVKIEKEYNKMYNKLENK